MTTIKDQLSINEFEFPILTGTESQIDYAQALKNQVREQWNKKIKSAICPELSDKDNDPDRKITGRTLENALKAKENVINFLSLTDSAKIIKFCKQEKGIVISDALKKAGWKEFF
jgi:hypothetical protein